MQVLRNVIVIAVGTIGTGAGCSDPSRVDAATVNEPIEVFSWWSSGGEVEALNALVKVYAHEHAGAEVTKTTVSDSSTASDTLNERFGSGTPPDVFLSSGGLCSWIRGGQALIENLDEFAQKQGWNDAAIMPQAVQDTVRCTGPDGAKHFYGVPVDIHRCNTLFYNKKILAELNLAPPTTVDQFFDVAEAIRTHMPDVAPLALGTAAIKGGAWPLSAMVTGALLAGMHGTSWYLKFYRGEADFSSTTTEDYAKTRAVFDTARRMMDYVNPNFEDLGWDDAAELLRRDEAALYVMGDWVNGTYLSEDWDGYGGRAAFGNSFIMESDALAVPIGAKNFRGALAFLEVVASRQGQDAFNRIKGGIPPRFGALDSTYSEYAREAADDFSSAGENLVLTTGRITSAEWGTGTTGQFNLFQKDKDVEAMMLVIRNAYGMLKK